jgi:putative sterol carrier protein
MPVFNTVEDAKQAFDQLFERILEIEDSNRRASAANVAVAVVYSDPDYFAIIDGRQSPTVLTHDRDVKFDIEIKMSSDTAHAFWKGDLSLPVAMMKGRVKIKGPAATVMKLLPVVAPGHQIYPQIVKELGIE